MLIGFGGFGRVVDGRGDDDEFGVFAFLRGAETETVLVGAGIVGGVFDLWFVSCW